MRFSRLGGLPTSLRSANSPKALPPAPPVLTGLRPVRPPRVPGASLSPPHLPNGWPRIAVPPSCYSIWYCYFFCCVYVLSRWSHPWRWGFHLGFSWRLAQSSQSLEMVVTEDCLLHSSRVLLSDAECEDPRRPLTEETAQVRIVL